MGVNGVTSSQWANPYGAYHKNSDPKVKKEEESKASLKTSEKDKTNSTDKSKNTEELYTKGSTLGKPTLSKAAADLYEKLQKKYGNMSFILVSEDQKKFAQQNVGAFGNSSSMVVLINEDKLEQMASDEKYAAEIEANIQAA